MGANTSNALFYLVTTLFDIYLWIVMLRIILQYVRADYYNPIAQLVAQLTQPIVRPFQKVLPKVRQIDTASCMLLAIVAVIDIYVIAAMLGQQVGGVAAL